ncbi:MAG TPA: hypothetical protein VFK05_28655 [Polyangiaceae bacterium]|nr:hypothetical protein [Polyangiaceae bacterium]
MANSTEIIEAFIKLGTMVKVAASKTDGKKDDWTAVLGTIVSDPALSKAVSDLFNQLKGKGSIDTALEGIRTKEKAILAEAGVPDASGLSGKALLNYHALATAELSLATQKVVLALNATFLDWVVDDALPALTKILPIIIAAL